ncbi:MAG: hypothetical protein ACYC9Y_13560 [Candidatus Methylomirabilia bacterium]
MKRIGLFLLAVVMVVGLAGCSKDDPYDFNGRWMVASQITKNPCGYGAVQGEIRIAQSGGTVIVGIPDGNQVGSGTCDEKAGTILFDVPSSSGGVVRWDGRGIDENTMTGSRKIVGGRCEFEANWTAILIER